MSPREPKTVRGEYSAPPRPSSREDKLCSSCSSLFAIKKALGRDGVPTVTGKRLWNIKTLHRIVNNGVYRTRDVEDLRAILPTGVADWLDPGKRCGVWWYGRHHQRYGRALGPNGSIELTGTLLAGFRSDNMGAMPNEEYHALAR
jgi:hypothetical protein